MSGWYFSLTSGGGGSQSIEDIAIDNIWNGLLKK